jgi:hypothetical protein
MKETIETIQQTTPSTIQSTSWVSIHGVSVI